MAFPVTVIFSFISGVSVGIELVPAGIIFDLLIIRIAIFDSCVVEMIDE